MGPTDEFRRHLMKSALGFVATQGLGIPAFAESSMRIRTEWQVFKKTAQCRSFLNAIAAMRTNTEASSPGSLQYWANVHLNYCPHGSPYFLSWHRGYLYYFEQQLRVASGDPTLNLPYWDYFAYSTMPAEFTDPSVSNPLYRARTGSNVYNALTLSPFAPGVYNFQRGTTNAFEVSIETAPHNPVHDLIGGVMSTMQSPLDPIFFLHHANIDRLTHAWALPDGKGIPDSYNPYSSTNSSPYWAGNNTYATNLTLARYLTLIPTWLGYDYANDTVPIVLPPMAVTAQASGVHVPAGLHLPSPQRPPPRSHEPVLGRMVSPTRRSLGGAARLSFDDTSFSTLLNLNKQDAVELGALITRRRAGKPRGNDKVPASAKLVLDGPALTKAGGLGGYFYALYVNMPAIVDSRAAHDRSFLGTLGAFQIASASHHGPARLEYDLAELLVKQAGADFSDLSLSWVRVDGDNPPRGQTIQVPETRIELSYETEPVEPPRKGRPGFYA